MAENQPATGHYSYEELARFQKTFAEDLKQYRAVDRRCAMPILAVLLAGFAALVCSFVLSQTLIKWLLGAGIFLIAAGFIVFVTAAVLIQKKLTCPACHQMFLDDLDACCPECGSAGLEPADWSGARHCNACGKNLRGGRNRNYRHKACTHCGVFLDEKGL